MKNTNELPEGYEEIYKIDLKNDKKTATLVHVVVYFIAILMIIIGLIFVPITTLWDLSNGVAVVYVKSFVVVAGIILCMFLQHILYGIAMKCFIKSNVSYGLTGFFSYTKSDAYFNKKTITSFH